MQNDRFTSARTFSSAIFALFTLLTWSMAPGARGQDYQGAITAKISEIKWTEDDLKAAKRELAILNQFLMGYDHNTAVLNTARSQLADADSKLAGIQQDNLVKLTIRMGIETYNTVSDTINLGKSAATALVTRGVPNFVGAAAMDQLTNGLTNESRAALGMDAASLSSPRTVKIKAVSDAATAAYPELGRVQQTLALSLEAIKAAAYHEDGTVLGDTGAILRKNIMVRDEMAAARAKLDAIGAEAAGAKTDAESNVTMAQAEVDRLTTELATLKSELETLKAQWAESEAAARLAANQAAVVPPVDQPIPQVAVDRGDMTEAEYQAAVAAAIRAAALARWISEAEPLLTQIESLKTQILTEQGEIDAALQTYISTPSVDYFVAEYRGNGTVSADTTASYGDAAYAAANLETWMSRVTPAQTALPGLIEKVNTLTDRYTSLANLQNKVQSLAQLMWDVGVGLPGSYAVALQTPGMGQTAAEDLSVRLEQTLSQLPQALTNAQSRIDKLIAATEAWGSGIGSVKKDIDDSLVAAETALMELIARGAAWESRLASSAGMTVDFAHGLQESRLGYFSGTNFVQVVKQAFDSSIYKNSLLAAVTTPGAAGLTAARELRVRYDALVAAAPALKDAFDAARLRFQAAFIRLESYTPGGYGAGFSVLDDWKRAANYTSANHPIDASGVTDQADRYNAMYGTAKDQHTTSLTGEAPVTGEAVLVWSGLPQLRQLPDPGMDDPAGFLPHRLASVKATIVEGSPTWIPLAPDAFDARYNEVYYGLMLLLEIANRANDGSANAVNALFGELGNVQEDYAAAHPAPVITVQPAGSVNGIPAGTTFSTQLSVTAAGDFLAYQWFMTPDPTDEFAWRPLPDSNRSTLTTPALTETRWFRVMIYNPGGFVTSEAAHVEVQQVYPAPVFTSAAAAVATVGVPFSWTFTTSIPGAGIFIQEMNNMPAWLTFSPAAGTLSGTPSAAGTWEISVTASNQGSFGDQTFRLTVTAPLKGDINGDGSVTLADAVSALRVCSGITPASPLNPGGDVDSDKKIGLPEVGYILQKLAGLR